jgi:deoxyribodipyrimidine photolyase
MATTTTKTGIPSYDAAFDQLRESGEQVLTAARKAGNLYLDSYEKAVDRTTELQLKLAGLTQQEWLKSLIEAQVDVTRELTGSYTTTTRSLLK